ncbi:MAG: hypothetical protein LH629_03375 [Ignavibacteria bacterium]|nr:hypothetical protein [Ignavibacteria bacterium]
MDLTESFEINSLAFKPDKNSRFNKICKKKKEILREFFEDNFNLNLPNELEINGFPMGEFEEVLEFNEDLKMKDVVGLHFAINCKDKDLNIISSLI